LPYVLCIHFMYINSPKQILNRAFARIIFPSSRSLAQILYFTLSLSLSHTHSLMLLFALSHLYVWHEEGRKFIWACVFELALT
jgi:hypothetical protein